MRHSLFFNPAKWLKTYETGYPKRIFKTRKRGLFYMPAFFSSKKLLCSCRQRAANFSSMQIINNEMFLMISITCPIWVIIVFLEGTVTNPAIWLVLYPVSIFLSLPTGHGNAFVSRRVQLKFRSHFSEIYLVFPAGQYF